MGHSHLAFKVEKLTLYHSANLKGTFQTSWWNVNESNHTITIVCCYHYIIAFLSPHHQTSALLSMSVAPKVYVGTQLAPQGTQLPRSSAVISMIPNWLIDTACKSIYSHLIKTSSSLTLLHFARVYVSFQFWSHLHNISNFMEHYEHVL